MVAPVYKRLQFHTDVLSVAAAVAPASVKLGGSELRVSPLGLGTLQWGDPGCGYGKQYDEASL